MSWIRVSDDFTDRPEFLELGDLEALTGWTYLRLLCWSGKHLSDGALPVGVVRREDPAAIAALVRMEYLAAAPDGGMVLTRFLADHHPAKADVLALRDKRTAAGQRGGQASASARAQAKAQASASRAVAEQTGNPVSRIPSPVNPVVPFPDARGTRAGSGREIGVDRVLD